MKKIFLLTIDFPPRHGGIANYLDAFATYFQKQIVVFVQEEQGGEQDNHQAPYSIIRTNFFYTFFWPHWLKSLFLLIKQSPSFDTVVVSHILPFGTVAWLSQIWTKKPYVVILHGLDFFLAQRSFIKRFFIKQILKKTEVLVTNSEALLSEVKDYFFFQKGVVVYPCVSSFFGGGKKTLAFSEIIHILTLSRLVKRKGHARVLQALALLKSHGKLKNIYYTIVGDGPEKPALEQLILDYGLKDFVCMKTAQTATEKEYFYKQTDLFVMPVVKDTVDREGFGIVYLEAALYGIPSIATDLPGVNEAIVHKKTGYLIPDGDIPALAEIIFQLAGDSLWRKQLGDQAYDRAKQEFTPEKQFAKLKPFL